MSTLSSPSWLLCPPPQSKRGLRCTKKEDYLVATASAMMHLALELGVQLRGSCHFVFILVGMPFSMLGIWKKISLRKKQRSRFFYMMDITISNPVKLLHAMPTICMEISHSDNPHSMLNHFITWCDGLKFLILVNFWPNEDDDDKNPSPRSLCPSSHSQLQGWLTPLKHHNSSYVSETGACVILGPDVIIVCGQGTLNIGGKSRYS